MFTQMFNNELYFMFNTVELISIICTGFILLLALILFVGITKTVSIPYLKAWLSPAKYLCLYLDKTHHVRLKAAKMKANVVKADGLPACAFVKNDNNGSYSLGALKIDIITGDVTHVYDDKYTRALEVLKRLGITDEVEACALLTAWQAEKYGGPEFNTAPILDRLANLPTEEDFEIMIPVFSRCSLIEVGRWIKLTPESIEGWTQGEIKEAIRKVVTKAGTLKGGMSGGMIGIIAAVGIIALIAVMALGGGAI